MSLSLAIILAGLVLTGGDTVASGSGHRIKASDVAVPEGTPMGQYRRVTQPFQNWTLICDEDLSKRQRVCNISQVILDASGEMAYNWTMAGTEAGEPMMIARVKAPIMGNRVTLDLADGEAPRSVVMECNSSLCAGLLDVDTRFERAITSGRDVEVTYTTAQGRIIKLSLPMAGLSQAAAALN